MARTIRVKLQEASWEGREVQEILQRFRKQYAEENESASGIRCLELSNEAVKDGLNWAH